MCSWASRTRTDGQRSNRVTTFTRPGTIAKPRAAAKLVVFSIKPQILTRVLPELKGVLREEQLLISIIAGSRIATLSEGLHHKAIVRSMPNTPAQVGAGMTVWTCTPVVSDLQRRQAAAIFQALGKEIFVDDEKYLDMATAVSGTGPTYTFLVLEALIDAAVHLGFSRDVAHDIVIETMMGSIRFAQQSGKHPAELRNMVTSPGGTSAEAIYQMEKGALRTVPVQGRVGRLSEIAHVGRKYRQSRAAPSRRRVAAPVRCRRPSRSTRLPRRSTA